MIRSGPGPVPITATQPGLSTDHLHRLAGRHGIYEHALFDRPRHVHGYTTDDNARALVVLSRSFPTSPLLEPCLRFVIAGRVPGGWHNRMSCRGRWVDHRGSDDAHGRALWGLANVADSETGHAARALALGFDLETTHPRANAYAVLAAAEAVRRLPGWAPGHRALRRFATRLPRPVPGAWMWPDERLTYGNARIPHALVEAGRWLDDEVMIGDGLDLLAWLIELEWGEAGFSFTPVGGRGPGDPSPAFDQQPIEAWAMADACAAAAEIDGERRWSDGLADASAWFLGENDAGAVLYDEATGAGFDGLHATGVNRNCGAESTLAALAVLGRTSATSAT